jgi:hypothetical protein
MRIVFHEEKRAGRNVMLTVALTDVHPLMRPLRMRVNVSNPAAIKVEPEPMGYRDTPDGAYLSSAMQIYSGLHTQEIASKLKEFLSLNLDAILKKKGYLDGLSEYVAPKLEEPTIATVVIQQDELVEALANLPTKTKTAKEKTNE